MTRIPGAIADLTGRGPDAGGPYNYSYYDNDKNSKNKYEFQTKHDIINVCNNLFLGIHNYEILIVPLKYDESKLMGIEYLIIFNI